MENRPHLDRELLIPILIGGFSIVGIMIVLLIGRAMNAPAEVAATPSATPFQYVYLGTEPAISTPLVEISEVAPSDGTSAEFPGEEFPTSDGPDFGIPTGASASTPLVLPTPNVTSTTGVIILTTNTPNRQITATATATLRNVTGTEAVANTYDDADPRLSYGPGWLPQTGVSGAYQGTLHISDVADNKSVTFNFTGQEIHFFYQTAPSFGVVTIYLDNDPLGITINQGQGNGEWTRMLDEGGSHTVEIAHTSGGSVNIDRFMIPGATPTPTRTPTATPTQ